MGTNTNTTTRLGMVGYTNITTRAVVVVYTNTITRLRVVGYNYITTRVVVVVYTNTTTRLGVVRNLLLSSFCFRCFPQFSALIFKLRVSSLLIGRKSQQGWIARYTLNT